MYLEVLNKIKINKYSHISLLNYNKTFRRDLPDLSTRGALIRRSPYPGNVAIGYAADAWQRTAPVFFRLLHIRYHRRPALVGSPAAALLPRTAGQRLDGRVGVT